MKHIKVCKPRPQYYQKEEKAEISHANNKPTDSKRESSEKNLRFLNEGLGCVPIGNLVGRDI